MTDRNDELLLALGWTRGTAGWWVDPHKNYSEPPQASPRPYDNLQDAMDCVPKGWQHWEAYCSAPEGGSGIWTWTLRHAKSGKEVFAQADTPAKTLSEAILKAVEANHE